MATKYLHPFVDYKELLRKSGMTFEELFSEEADEIARLTPRNRFVPIEEVPAETPSMEELIDELRAFERMTVETEKGDDDARWKDYVPTPHDLLPFHMTMAASVVDEDLPIIAYFSSFPGRRHQKITYHRGERSIRTKAGF